MSRGDLARAPLACLLDRLCTVLFRKANISIMKNFQLQLFGGINKSFSNKPPSKTWLKCKSPFLTQKAIICSRYKDLR